MQVREERSGWRDQRISERHRAWCGGHRRLSASGRDRITINTECITTWSANSANPDLAESARYTRSGPFDATGPFTGSTRASPTARALLTLPAQSASPDPAPPALHQPPARSRGRPRSDPAARIAIAMAVPLRGRSGARPPSCLERRCIPHPLPERLAHERPRPTPPHTRAVRRPPQAVLPVVRQAKRHRQSLLPQPATPRCPAAGQEPRGHLLALSVLCQQLQGAR